MRRLPLIILILLGFIVDVWTPYGNMLILLAGILSLPESSSILSEYVYGVKIFMPRFEESGYKIILC